MQVDETLVTYITTTYYNVTPILGSVKPLCGYNDTNFSLVDLTDHQTYVLKIVNPDESQPELVEIVDEVLDRANEHTRIEKLTSQFQVAKLVHTTGLKSSAFTHVKCLSSASQLEESRECNVKLWDHFDGITMFELMNQHSAKWLQKPSKLYMKLGRIANELLCFFRSQQHLCEKLARVRRSQTFEWRIMEASAQIKKCLLTLGDKLDPSKVEKIERVLAESKDTKFEQKLNNLPPSIIHSDLCNRNILVDRRDAIKGVAEWSRLCIIDFQDIQVAPRVAELAIMILYCVLEQEQWDLSRSLDSIPAWVLRGFQSAHSDLSLDAKNEISLVPMLMKLRLCVSLLMGQLAFQENPENSYVMHSNQRGWRLLELLLERQNSLELLLERQNSLEHQLTQGLVGEPARSQMTK